MRPIDADALLETLKHWYTHAKQDVSSVEGKVALHYGALRFTEEIVKHMPALTIDDLREKGKWVKPEGRSIKSYVRRCSYCGKDAYFCGEGCSYKFCPNCGHPMMGGGE